MENKKIILAGGSGFIGQEMTRYFGDKNNIVVLGRAKRNSKNNRNEYNSLTEKELQNTRFVQWDGVNSGVWVKELESADLVVNLTGKTVNCRYTEKNKQEIMASRINAVNAIGAAINECKIPPKLWINASSATIYRYALDHAQDEYTETFHEGFSVQVCREWERAFYEQQTALTRKVALRMAITLGPGGVLIPYFNLLKFGLGGKQGNGKQMFSWIHAEDICRMVDWIAEHPALEGTYNCCAPNPVTNKEFMKLLRDATGHPFGLPAYTWMLKIGAALIGTETELILKSRWVIPTKILETGFIFKYPFLKDAFADIISKTPEKQYKLF